MSGRNTIYISVDRQVGTYSLYRNLLETNGVCVMLEEEKIWNVFNKNCPTRMVLDRIADKWTVLVVSALKNDTKRFGTLKKEIDGISQKMLTKTLRGMERDGLIKRKAYPTIPPKVEYSLTPLGMTLVGVLQNIQLWAESNIEKMIKSQRKFDVKKG